MTATGQDPQTIQDTIVTEFEDCADWFARYQRLVSLGDALGEQDLGEEHRLQGCQSQVWLRADLEGGSLRLQASSDARITRGIISLLLRVADGQPPQEVAALEFDFLHRIGLRQQLSPARANGLTAIVRRIREVAREHVNHRS
ncbi:MAG: SufE family protein [Planctomycetota bacterium]